MELFLKVDERNTSNVYKGVYQKSDVGKVTWIVLKLSQKICSYMSKQMLNFNDDYSEHQLCISCNFVPKIDVNVEEIQMG